jgi:hypothetical protein
MPQTRLRVYLGPQDDGVATLDAPRPPREQVTVSLGEVFPLLADAVDCERTWLQDFEDDEITISTDLYEVILAYQHYRRPTG